MKEYVERCRKWQKENPDWELVCDIEDSNIMYIQWSELSKKERRSWIDAHGASAEDAFNDFATKRCKVETKSLDSNLELCEEWPPGPAMLVFRTSVDGVPIIER